MLRYVLAVSKILEKNQQKRKGASELVKLWEVV